MKTHIETLLYTTTPSITTIIIWYNDVIILIHNLLLAHQSYLLSQIQQSLLQMKFPPCHNSPDYIACDRLPLDLQNWHDRYSTSTAVLLYGIGTAHAWLNDAAFFFLPHSLHSPSISRDCATQKSGKFFGKWAPHSYEHWFCYWTHRRALHPAKAAAFSFSKSGPKLSLLTACKISSWIFLISWETLFSLHVKDCVVLLGVRNSVWPLSWWNSIKNR